MVFLGKCARQGQVGSILSVTFALTPDPEQRWINHLHRRGIEDEGKPNGVQSPNAQRDPGRIGLVFDPTLAGLEEIHAWLMTMVDEANRIYGG